MGSIGHVLKASQQHDDRAKFVGGIYVGSGPGSVVGIATAYVLDGPGIESRWGEIFRTSPDRP